MINQATRCFQSVTRTMLKLRDPIHVHPMFAKTFSWHYMTKIVVVHDWYASGCVVACRICNREVAGSNLGLGYFAPRSTQPSIPLGSVNEYQLRLGRQRQVWLIPCADETQGVQVKLCYPLTMRALPERLRDASCGALYKSTTFTFFRYYGGYL